MAGSVFVMDGVAFESNAGFLTIHVASDHPSDGPI